MIRSMTGFGSAAAEEEGEALAVEVRTVNHRFCDVKTRVPRELAALEPLLARRVRERLDRGAVEVTLRRSRAGAAAGRVRLNLELARDYVARLEELEAELGLSGEISLALVAEAEGVLGVEDAPVDLERLERMTVGILDGALDQVVAMREREGASLAADLDARLSRVLALLDEVGEEAPRAVDAYRERLEARIAELARGVDADPQRLATEVAILADKSDVSEEITRLRSHVEQVRGLLQARESVGRKLDFLVQEMNREVNTIGSKSQNAEIAQHVVEMKAEIERVREQVQNVE